jgi:uncharacterized protein with NRDE domain
MCLIVFALDMHPVFDLVIAGNRDERHARPTAAVDWWSDAPGLLAGRDLEAGGTWLGLHRTGRIAAVTNFREGQARAPGAPSRGELVADFLQGQQPPQAYLATLRHRAPRYAGFSLLLADAHELWYASNRAEYFARRLPAGIYGLSNDLLDTPWPKLVRSRERLTTWIDRGGLDSAPLLELLADRELAQWGPVEPSAELERRASAPFIVHEDYGTRCSTLVTRRAGERLEFVERRFAAAGRPEGETAFTVSSAAMEPAAGAEL